MPSFTNTFGGTNIYPSDVSYRAITLSANTTLAWPTEVATDSNVAAEIMDVTATVAGLTIRMPPAIEASVGQTALFFNPGANAFTIADNGGNVITVVAAGESWQVYITDNTTANGAWRTVEYGAGTSAPAAGSLAGKGIKAITTTLNQSMPVVTYPIIPGTYSYTLDEALRASTVIWDSSSTGTLTFAQATANGADWFCHIRNNGAGSVVLNCAVGDQINGVSSLTFGPGDSATLICDGNNYFTIGQGNASTSGILAFDYVALDLTGVVSPYILQGVELNRVSYNFIGTLTSNMEIVVPLNLQQYWVKNSTSGPHTLVVKTLSGGGVQVQQGYAQILYCNGVNVVAANDPPGVTDIPVSAGGIYVDNFSGNGITQIFNLTYAVINEDRTQVYVNGVYQQKNTYTVSGATLTFSVAPPVGATIEVVSLGAANYPANSVSFTPYGNLTSTNVQDAIEEEIDDLAAGTGSSLIGYNQGGTSAVNRTVESRLRDTVSVKDFGAVGDGVADDTAAIQAAVDSGAGEVIFPTGSYRLKMIFIDVGNVRLIGNNATIIQYHDNVNSIVVGSPGEYKVSAAFFTKRGCANVEITGFTFTTNDASFPVLAAGFGSYFPSIGGQFSDNVYIHHNNFQGGQDRCMFFQAGKNLRFENNNIQDNGFTVHIGYAANQYFYDSTTDTSLKYSPIAPSFINNVFDGYSSDRSTVCAHLTGCTEFVCRDNRFLNMSIGSIGSLRVLRLYSNDFGPYDENGNQLSYIQGICAGNVINGTFDYALEVDGDSVAATSTWTSSYNMRILVEGNNIQGTGNGIKTNEIQNTKFFGNAVNVTESVLYMTGRMVYCNISNNTFTSTAGGYNDTMFYSGFGGGSSWITFNNNRVNASAASQYLFNENQPITWFICNENNFFFDGDVTNARPIILRIANKAWFKNNVFNIETDVADVSVLVLTGSGPSASVNIEANHVTATNGTGASTVRFCSVTGCQDVNIHNNITGGMVLVEDADRTYITNNTIIMPSAHTLQAVKCNNTGYAAKALVEIHSNYILSTFATIVPCVSITSNNDATLNTTSKVTMNYISCNSSASPLAQFIEGELGVIGNTILNAGAGGSAPSVSGAATLVSF